MIIRYLLNRIYSRIFANHSFSQEGEDMIVSRLFNKLKIGFYVDVGAHHPFRFSNTAKLYRNGWHGINIEPNPIGYKKLNRFRKRDVNLNIGISSESKKMRYYMFNDGALNTFDSFVVSEHLRNTNYKVVDELVIELRSLTSVLDSLSIPVDGIDLLTVDVEGFDLMVLESLDWLKYRPKVIIAEVLNSKFDSLKDNELCRFVISNNYTIFSRLYNSVIFISNDFDV